MNRPVIPQEHRRLTLSLRILPATIERLKAESARTGLSVHLLVDQLALTIDQSGEPRMTVDQFTRLLSRALHGHRIEPVEQPVGNEQDEQAMLALIQAARYTTSELLATKEGLPDTGGIRALRTALEAFKDIA